MTPVNRSAALIAAAAAATGWIARCELDRRRRTRRPSPSGADKLRAAITADRGSAWTWSRLRRILASAEPGDTAVSITVVFASPDRSQVVATMGRDDEYPVLAVLTEHADEQGRAWWAYHSIPDDASGLEGTDGHG